VTTRKVFTCCAKLPPGVLRSTWAWPKFPLRAQRERSPIKVVNGRCIGLRCQRAGEPLDQNRYEQHLLSYLLFQTSNVPDYYTLVHIILGPLCCENVS
jgi:hypothetical protein